MFKDYPLHVIQARKLLPWQFQMRLDDLIAKAKFEMNNDPLLHPEKFMKRKLYDGTIIDLSKTPMRMPEEPARKYRKRPRKKPR